MLASPHSFFQAPDSYPALHFLIPPRLRAPPILPSPGMPASLHYSSHSQLYPATPRVANGSGSGSMDHAKLSSLIFTCVLCQDLNSYLQRGKGSA